MCLQVKIYFYYAFFAYRVFFKTQIKFKRRLRAAMLLTVCPSTNGQACTQLYIHVYLALMRYTAHEHAVKQRLSCYLCIQSQHEYNRRAQEQ